MCGRYGNWLWASCVPIYHPIWPVQISNLFLRNLAWSETTWTGNWVCVRPHMFTFVPHEIASSGMTFTSRASIAWSRHVVFVAPFPIHSRGNSSCKSFLQGVRPLHYHQSVHPSLLAEGPCRTRTAGNVLKLAQKHPGTSSHPLVWAPTSPTISQWFSSSAVAERAWAAYCAGGSLKPTWVWAFALVRILLFIII